MAKNNVMQRIKNMVKHGKKIKLYGSLHESKKYAF